MSDVQLKLKMVEENKPSVEDWGDFSGVYLKPEDVAEWPLVAVPIDIETEFNEGKAKLSIITEYKGRTRKIGINKTNIDILKSAGMQAPKQLIGMKLFFDKTKVRNPSTGGMVDSFVIDNLERP